MLILARNNILSKIRCRVKINYKRSLSKKITILEKMEEEFDEKFEEGPTVQALTTKEIKKLIRPRFEADPEKYYPTKFLKSVGFIRKKCPISGHFYWSKDGKAPNCGDSEVTGEYQFIGEPQGIGKEKKMTLANVWQTMVDSFGSEEVPCTPIDRYPVVARWRNDVDFVLAGIFCFQPYCVTGELDPPANPLIQPQFCARFNDLDNIGLTGRHYSGFIMLGNQVFNKPNDYKYFKEESVMYNYNWLTKHLKIDPEDITFIEDIWAGGGNLGPCMEYFIKGMEMGNMVFMQYKTFHDGTLEELPITVCDTGIGLERFPWLLNGSATSYTEVFPKAFEYFRSKLDIPMDNKIWEKFGPYSCRLNVDEVDDLDKTWKEISELINEPVEQIKTSIEPIRDMFIILDHTRTCMMIISDGALPSNTGGGSNLRNELRRTFALMRKNGWWDKLTFDEYLEIFQKHKEDLEPLYGKFKPYKSFNGIIKMEYERWLNTDEKMQAKLKKFLKKKKGKLTMDDWIVAMTSWGIPPDEISKISGLEIPGNLYYEIATRQERIVKAGEQILYNTSHLPETLNLYYDDHKKYEFEAKIVDVFANVKKNNIRNIVILDQSVFYPTSGGQHHDNGILDFGGESYEVVDCEKVGHCVLHILDREVSKPNDELIGMEVKGGIDEVRRAQLRNHHTATHIVFASCRRVLGPHVWQQGAKKTVKRAHLDITHYSSLSNDEIMAIQNQANRIIMESRKISKTLMEKSEAEQEYGFSLYQGGIVPGNELRVVNIEGTDVEACCGTHCDNTSEVGWIKILTAKRVADGIVRLFYVAGERSIDCLNAETKVINNLTTLWGISQNNIVPTAKRFFTDYKKFKTEIDEGKKVMLSMQVKYVCNVEAVKKAVYVSNEPNPTLYFSNLDSKAADIKNSGKAIVYVGNNFVYGIAASKDLVDIEKLTDALKPKEEEIQENDEKKEKKKQKKFKLNTKNKVGKKKKAVKDILGFSAILNLNREDIVNHFVEQGFVLIE